MAPALATMRPWSARAPEIGAVQSTSIAAIEQTERRKESSRDKSPAVANYPLGSQHGYIEESKHRGVASSHGTNPRAVRESGNMARPQERRYPTDEAPAMDDAVGGQVFGVSPSAGEQKHPLGPSISGGHADSAGDGANSVGSYTKSSDSSDEDSSVHSGSRNSFFFGAGFAETSQPESRHPKDSEKVVTSGGMVAVADASQPEGEIGAGRRRTGGDGEVNFPPGFDTAAKGSDSDENGKRCGGSLGTKSGSTSLLSMLSGSPRSLSTNQDSAAGSSPRTPASEPSSDGAQQGTGRARSSARSARASKRAPAGGASAPSSDSNEAWSNAPRVSGDARSSSNRPTALPEADEGDEEVPSAHPTPLSSGRLVSDESSGVGVSAGKDLGHGAAPARSGSNVSNVSSKASTVITTKVKTGSASSTFMDRLRYWGGGAGAGAGATAAAAAAAGKKSHGQNSGFQTAMPFSDGTSHSFDGAEGNGTSPKGLSPGGDADGVARAKTDGVLTNASPSQQQRKQSSKNGGEYDSASGPRASPNVRHRPGSEAGWQTGFVSLETPPGDLPPGGESASSSRASPLLSSPRGTSVAKDVSPSTSSEAIRENARRVSPAKPTAPWTDDEWREEEKAEEDAESVESEMNWDASSEDEKDGDDGEEEEKKELSDVESRVGTMEASDSSFRRSGTRRMDDAHSRRSSAGLEEVSGSVVPSYLALVDAASVHSGLDSSTSGHDTSPSEDGGMMAEILTDRVMEVCTKMEEATAPTAADRLSEAEDGLQQYASRRMSNISSYVDTKDQVASRRASFQSAFFSTSAPTEYERRADSDEEGSVLNDGAAARRLRRETIRKRSRSRRALSSALSVPTDASGAVINIHTAAYNGEADMMHAYISQGGDLEVRDQFQATSLMLCAERNHVRLVEALINANVDVCAVDENGNSALHLACFYGHREVVRLLLGTEDVNVAARDAEGRAPLHLATDPAIRRMVQGEEMLRISSDKFELLEAVEVNDTTSLSNFIRLGQEACGYPHNASAIPLAAKRLRIDRKGRGGMTAVHLSAFHGYGEALTILLEAGADANAVCDDGETPLHTACTGGSIKCASILLDHGANPLATDAKGLVPCEKHVAGGRQEMKHLLESKAFQATPANLLALRMDLAEAALQIDAEEDLFVRMGVAIKYLRKGLKKKDADAGRLRSTVDSRDVEIRNLRGRMESVEKLLSGIVVK